MTQGVQRDVNASPEGGLAVTWPERSQAGERDWIYGFLTLEPPR